MALAPVVEVPGLRQFQRPVVDVAEEATTGRTGEDGIGYTGVAVQVPRVAASGAYDGLVGLDGAGADTEEPSALPFLQDAGGGGGGARGGGGGRGGGHIFADADEGGEAEAGGIERDIKPSRRRRWMG